MTVWTMIFIFRGAHILRFHVNLPECSGSIPEVQSVQSSKNSGGVHFLFPLHSGKPTWQWKMDPLKMNFLLKMGICPCYASLPEGRLISAILVPHSYAMRVAPSIHRVTGEGWDYEPKNNQLGDHVTTYTLGEVLSIGNASSWRESILNGVNHMILTNINWSHLD